MIEGILRAELAALLSGALCLFVSLYTSLGASFLMFRIRRSLLASPGELNLSIPSSGIFPREDIEGMVSVPLPKRIFPGFAVSVRLPFSFPGRKSLRERPVLPPGSFGAAFRLSPRKRGRWILSESSVLVRDVFGLSETGLALPMGETLIVYPDMEHPSGEVESETGGRVSLQGDRLKRSDEFLETRKYYPGDDVRRLSWKLYAHSGELFLKIGEETPPPHSRLLVLVDTGVEPSGFLSPFLGTEGLADYLDQLIVACADFCLSAMNCQMEVLLSFSGLASPLSFSSGMERDLLAACSGITFSSQGEIPPLPIDEGLKAFLFAMPRSPSLPILASGGEAARYPVSVFFRGVPFGHDTARISLRGIFVRDEGMSRSEREREAALHRELADGIAEERARCAQRGYETHKI